MLEVIDTLSPAPPVGTEVVAGTLLGRFRVEARLGAGAMGVVYTARDEQLGRKVAVKLVKNPTGGAAAARFLREAQVMAKLAHPNVAVIYDAGEIDGRLFIAMELVEGETVASWLERTHSSREVVALFVQAGHGLAAAHAAGVVHRDFKPANVLVGQDRARVVDFGLASDAGDLPEAASSDVDPAHAATLTQTGMVLGTPAYMAPEQRVGARTTPAGDQYSFCVSLWEALAGARPGVASQPRPIRRAIRRVLERGLAADPDERWPSMAALLDELEPAARSPRIAIAASAIAVASVGVAIAIALREPERPSCAPAQDRLAGVWDADRKATMHSAFLASRLPYAEHTWQLVEQTLDGYAAGWAKRSDDTCHATEHAELPRAVADARRQCLDHRLDRLRLWVDLFSERDPRLVRDGTRAAGGLEDLADCDDPEAVSDMQPTNPILAAEVTALRERVNAAALSTTYRDYGKGVAQLRELAVAVKALDYQPLVVETLIQIGHAEYVGTEYKASLATFAAVRDLVETTHQDLQRARAWSGMSYVYGMLQQYDAAHDAARVARAILRPLSSSAARQARIGVDQSEAVAYWGEGKRDDALELLRKVDRELRAINGDRFQLAGNEVTLGGLLGEIGRYDDGNAYLDRALHRYIELQGDSHPAIASIINNQGGNYFFQGDYVHAAERYREAIAARDRAGIPADNIGRAYNWLNLGEALVHLGRADDALDAIAKARPIVASKLGEATTVFAELLTYTALAELARAKPDAALPSAERAVAIYRSVKPDPDDLAEAELAFARAVWPTDRVRARELAAAARDHFTKAPRKQEVEQWLASHR